MELELKGATYRTGRLDAFRQFHVARRLAPVVFALGQSASEIASHLKLEPAEGSQELPNLKDTSLDSVVELFQPVADVLSKMSDSDVDYVLKACLGACERKQGDGWQKVQAGNGRLMFEDVDLGVMMQLSVAVIRENLGNFFPVPPAESQSGQAS